MIGLWTAGEMFMRYTPISFASEGAIGRADEDAVRCERLRENRANVQEIIETSSKIAREHKRRHWLARDCE